MWKSKGGLDRTKKKYHNDKCKIIEKNKLGKTRELFQEIREITGQPKINTGVLKRKMNNNKK